MIVGGIPTLILSSFAALLYTPTMASRTRDPLPHLPTMPINLQGTALQHPYHPHQPFFIPHPPPAPGRSPHHPQLSIAQLAAAGIHPPNGFPMSPMGGHFSRPSMMAIPNQGQPPPGPPFPHRNRRQLSIGGPPKAVLGGPARKLSPLPVAQATPPSALPPKVKKLNVNLPKETILREDGKPHSRPSWARTPSTASKVTHQYLPPAETITAELYPSDEWAKHMPNTIDVFLPGKVCSITLSIT
jgi:hypothetical protein